MNKSPLKNWLCSIASEFVEGIADGFIIVSGGAQTFAAMSADKVSALTLQQLGYSMLLAGAWYVAAFVKKNPPPFGQSADTPPPPAATS